MNSQEVVRNTLRYMRLTSARREIKLNKVIAHFVIYFHDGSFVARPKTIVGSRENRDALFVVCPRIPVHRELVRAADQLHAICLQELLSDVLAERIPCTSGRPPPPWPDVGV